MEIFASNLISLARRGITVTLLTSKRIESKQYYMLNIHYQIIHTVTGDTLAQNNKILPKNLNKIVFLAEIQRV